MNEKENEYSKLLEDYSKRLETEGQTVGELRAELRQLNKVNLQKTYQCEDI
jgi:hypothetical protein